MNENFAIAITLAGSLVALFGLAFLLMWLMTREAISTSYIGDALENVLEDTDYDEVSYSVTEDSVRVEWAKHNHPRRDVIVLPFDLDWDNLTVHDLVEYPLQRILATSRGRTCLRRNEDE